MGAQEGGEKETEVTADLERVEYWAERRDTAGKGTKYKYVTIKGRNLECSWYLILVGNLTPKI